MTEHEIVLPERELRILELVADGFTDDQIARTLGITASNVSYQRSHLYARIGARNGPHAVAIGYRRGLLGGES